MPTTVEEVLRWASPVMHFRRTAMKDTEIRGVPIAEGDKVVIWYISATATKKSSGQPRRRSTSGARRTSTSPSAAAALTSASAPTWPKLEIRVMFEELSKRLPDIALDGDVRRCAPTSSTASRRCRSASHPRGLNPQWPRC